MQAGFSKPLRIYHLLSPGSFEDGSLRPFPEQTVAQTIDFVKCP